MPCGTFSFVPNQSKLCLTLLPTWPQWAPPCNELDFSSTMCPKDTQHLCLLGYKQPKTPSCPPCGTKGNCFLSTNPHKSLKSFLYAILKKGDDMPPCIIHKSIGARPSKTFSNCMKVASTFIAIQLPHFGYARKPILYNWQCIFFKCLSWLSGKMGSDEQMTLLLYGLIPLCRSTNDQILMHLEHCVSLQWFPKCTLPL